MDNRAPSKEYEDYRRHLESVYGVMFTELYLKSPERVFKNLAVVSLKDIC